MNYEISVFHGSVNVDYVLLGCDLIVGTNVLW
jgi:hypothetical protein